MSYSSKQGFTLVEISIVLVIVGLIIGGVLVGRDMIHAAAIRATISQKEKFELATNAFRFKYNCLPGDCLTATTFFGAKADCGVGVVPDQETCNGNGNGFITPSGGSVYEDLFFWQHLSNAKLIEGNYHATDYFNNDNLHPDTTLPKTKMDEMRFSILFLGSTHQFVIGKYPAEDYYSIEDGMRPADAFGIDSKIDDGIPNTGKVYYYTGYNGDNNQCSNGGSPATYDLANPTNVCALIVSAAF